LVSKNNEDGFVVLYAVIVQLVVMERWLSCFVLITCTLGLAWKCKCIAQGFLVSILNPRPSPWVKCGLRIVQQVKCECPCRQKSITLSLTLTIPFIGTIMDISLHVAHFTSWSEFFVRIWVTVQFRCATSDLSLIQ